MYTNRGDRCKGISEGSMIEAKQAANQACEQAFLALDRLGLNACTNWSRPECRAIPNQPHRICSVITSPCPLYVAGNLIVSNSRLAGKPYFCDICGLTYSDHKTLTSHLKSHKEDYKCHDCDTYYNNKSSFNEHMRRFHGAEREIPGSDIKPYECDECHKRSTNWDGVVQHKASHTDATTCLVCQKKYGKISSLKEHIKKKHPGTG